MTSYTIQSPYENARHKFFLALTANELESLALVDNRLQLTLEQYGFELCKPIYTWKFLNKYLVETSYPWQHQQI